MKAERSIRDTARRIMTDYPQRMKSMTAGGKMRIDKPKDLGFFVSSIPAKPLAKAKRKCGGFFIAHVRQGGFA
jgi:hypothetical protein